MSPCSVCLLQALYDMWLRVLRAGGVSPLIYLFVCAASQSGTRDLSLWCMDPLVAACRLSWGMWDLSSPTRDRTHVLLHCKEDS